MKQTNKMHIKTSTENWLFVFGLLSVIQQTGTKQTSTRRNNIAECRQMETPQRLWAVFRQSHNFSDQIFQSKQPTMLTISAGFIQAFPNRNQSKPWSVPSETKTRLFMFPPLRQIAKSWVKTKWFISIFGCTLALLTCSEIFQENNSKTISATHFNTTMLRDNFKFHF